MGAEKTGTLVPVTLDSTIDAAELSLLGEYFPTVVENYGGGAAKFLVLCYDKKSPLALQYPSISRRKKEAIALLGLDGMAEELTVMVDDVLIEAVFQYLVRQDDMLWAMIAANGDSFIENLRETGKPLVASTNDKNRLDALAVKAKALQTMQDIEVRLETMLARFTGGDKELASAIGTFRRITPEVVAKLDLKY